MHGGRGCCWGQRSKRALSGVSRASRVLAELQRGEGEEGEDEGEDPEAGDDFGFAPAKLFEVVVERGHLEDALLAEFVAADLEHDGNGFEDEDSSDEGEEEFLADDHGYGADGSAQSERSDIAHEDFCRVGVVPEKTNARSYHRSAEDGEFGDQRHALKLEVVGEDDVAADVGENGECAGGDDCAADGEPVKAIG